MRLITDTCAAIKLVAFGDKLFRPGVLKNGDLVLHPRVFNETRRWPPYKKAKYKTELDQLQKIKAAVGLKPPADEVESLSTIISSVMDEMGTSIGSADREQLISAVFNNAEIVTNDMPFTEVAEAMDVTVHTAERIVIDACTQGVISKAEVKVARALWVKNGEKAPTRDEEKELKAICN